MSIHEVLAAAAAIPGHKELCVEARETQGRKVSIPIDGITVEMTAGGTLCIELHPITPLRLQPDGGGGQ